MAIEFNTKGLIEEKSCVVCEYCPKSIGSDICTACLASGVKIKFSLAHSCLTCKHSNKKITDEPCMDCKTLENKLLSKWEEVEHG